MSPEALQAEVERLRVELAQEREARRLSDARLDGFREALALVSSGRHADTSGRLKRIQDGDRERKRAQRERQRVACHADSSGSHAEVTVTHPLPPPVPPPPLPAPISSTPLYPPPTPPSPTSPSQGELLAVQAPRKARAKRQPSGPHQELWTALEAEYQQRMGHAYISTNGDRDGKAVKWLVEHSTPAEAVARWGRLLEWAKGGFPAVTGFSALQQHWNTAQVAGATQGRAQRGAVMPADEDAYAEAWRQQQAARTAGGGT